jgi:hypothetical protein
MIVRGDFESVSMAIYGESEPSPAGTSYIPGSLQLPSPVSISPALDLAKASDPTYLARQLLALIPDAPSLNLVIRLMFCLKPPNDDWDLPEYPHLYSDLSEEELDIDLDSAFHCLSRPVADDIQLEPLQRFAEKVADAIGPMVRGEPTKLIYFSADHVMTSRMTFRLIWWLASYVVQLHSILTLPRLLW